MRRVIKFKPEMLDLVLEGVKTTTIRPANGSEYGEVLKLSDRRRSVSARLVSVKKIKLSEAVKHYRSEGFDSPEEMVKYLRRIYRDLEPDSEINLIEFRLEEVDGRP